MGDADPSPGTDLTTPDSLQDPLLNPPLDGGDSSEEPLLVRPTYLDGLDGLGGENEFILQATQQFVDEVSLIEKHLCHDPVPRNTAVKFLMARKFDVTRAVELYFSHQETRRRENLHGVDPLDPKLRRELLTEKFTVLTSRDESGASIALFTAKRHRPATTSHQDTLKGLIFQLDAALDSHETQRNGLVFIYDMTDSKYRNFDYELSIKILTMLKGAYPARLKKVLIVTAPLWFKAPFKILRLFVREKLRDRVYTVSRDQLTQHIVAENLPQHLGGLLVVDHREWLRHCLRTMANQVSPTADQTINCAVDTFFAAANNTSGPNSPSSGESDNLDAFEDGELESEDSHETVPEKHNDEDREKEVEFEKDDSGQKRIQPELPENVPPSKRTADASVNDCSADQQKDCTIVKSPSKLYEDSIHVPESSAQSMEDFIRYCRQKRKKRLQSDYMQIKTEAPSGTFLEAKKKVNAVKNRYTDVLCYDHSRVRLEREDEDDDYINANYVDGYKHKHAYINTQGPLPRTFGDFWEMVWQQQVTTIVMTTRTIERSRLKCGQYWPREESAVEYGEYIVINNGVRTTPDYIQTSLVLQNLQSGATRELTHLQFISWPDYGVPHSASAFLDFLVHVRQVQEAHVLSMGGAWAGHPLGPPIVVHCSAGIGRTGTFCTIDICLRQLADVGTVDVERTVRRIRSQRAFSIQMPDQYIFCHLALIEHAQRHNLVQNIDLKGFDDSDSESD